MWWRRSWTGKGIYNLIFTENRKISIISKPVSNRLSVGKVKPPKILYQYIDFKNGIDHVIGSSSLKLSKVDTLNDPFDCSFNPLWNIYDPNKKDCMAELAVDLYFAPEKWPSNSKPNLLQMAERRSEFNKRVDSSRFQTERMKTLDNFKAHLEAHREHSYTEYQKRRSKLRTRSMSRHWDSVLMWSHYADNHRGLVFGFDTSLAVQNPNIFLLPIKYSNSFPVAITPEDWVKSVITGCPMLLDEENVALASVLTKSIQWKYECEWRYITAITTDDELVIHYPRAALREVILGCNSSENHASKVLDALGTSYPDAEVFKCRASDNSFKLNRVQYFN